MSCDHAPQLHRYHDGELDKTERPAVEAHLGHCRECRAMLSELRALSRMVMRAPLPMPSQAGGYAQHMADRTLRANGERGVRRLAEWITAVAAAVILVAWIGWPASQAPYRPMAEAPMAASLEWEQAAVTGPTLLAMDDSNRELIQLTQWMATDLSADAPDAAR